MENLNKQCPLCIKKFKTEGRKLSVPYLINQPTTGLQYRKIHCPKCTYHEVHNLETGHIYKSHDV